MLARLLTLAHISCEVFEADLSVDSRRQGGMLDLHEGTGIAAVRQAGLYDAFRAEVLENGDALRILDREANVHLDRPGNGHRPEIERGTLRKLLVESLPKNTVRWNSRVTSVKQADPGFHLSLASGEEVSAKIVIGADGAWSRVRPILTQVQPVYSGVVYAELYFADAGNRHPEASTLVGDGMMFALDDNRGFAGHREPRDQVSLYAFLRLPEVNSASQMTAQDLFRYFTGWHSDYFALLARNDGFVVRPLYNLPVGLRWNRVPGATLLGDAAHLMSPFAGEGVNQALADAADLAEQISLHPNNLEIAFTLYEERMYQRSAEVAAESLKMLDLLVSPDPLPILLNFFSNHGGS
jgi:2-polyprenyl-6-methoxyphenol hydroxylase-like FAD-dependent oxidoreductase